MQSPVRIPISVDADVFARLPGAQEFAATNDAPIAVRGCVLLLPIARRSPEVPWPLSLDLRLGDGRRVTGRIAKVEVRSQGMTGWTSPLRVTATTQAEGDDDIVLLAQLPIDGDDDFMLGDQRITPMWMDGLTTSVTGGRSEQSLRPEENPDPTAPSEYFRTVLQAYRMGTAPSTPEGDELDSLFARASAGLWSGAIARLEENDRATSNRVLGDLVGRAHGVIGTSAVTMAAWKTDEDDLDALLRALLAPGTDGIVIVESAKLWLENRSPLLCWVERDEGDGVVIGVANPRAEPHSLRFRWPDQRDPSLLTEIGPESFQTYLVPRTRQPEPDTVAIDDSLSIAMHEQGLTSLLPPANLSNPSQARTAIEAQARAQPILTLEHGTNVLAIPVGSGRVPIRPPGLGFGTFLPIANLHEMRAGSLKSPPEAWSTSAGIRRRPSGWEVLVQCRFPVGANPITDQIALVVEGGSSHFIKVSRDGTVETDDPSTKGSASVHRSSDRWRVRFPLPERWVSGSDGRVGHLGLSISRVVNGSGSDAPPEFARRQFAGLAPLGIAADAKGIPLELSSWDLESVTLAP